MTYFAVDVRTLAVEWMLVLLLRKDHCVEKTLIAETEDVVMCCRWMFGLLADSTTDPFLLIKIDLDATHFLGTFVVDLDKVGWYLVAVEKLQKEK